MWSITLADFRFRARQFVIGIVAAGVLFSMTLLLSGMAAGFHTEVRTSVTTIGADRWIVPGGASGPFTSAAALQQDIVTLVAAEPGVVRADPVVTVPQVARVGRRSRNVVLIGFMPGGLGQQTPYRGRSARGTGEAVVDQRLGIDLGDHFVVGAKTTRVVGLVHGHTLLGGRPELYLPIDDARAVAFSGQPYESAVVTRGHPAQTPAGLNLLTNAQVQRDAFRPMANGAASIANMRLFMWAVAGIIVAALMYVSALARVRDFAVLKSLGASSAVLFEGIAVQALVISLLAAVLGIVVSRFLKPAMTLPVFVPASAYVLLPVAAVAVGLVASLAGLRRAITADPVAAFAAG